MSNTKKSSFFLRISFLFFFLLLIYTRFIGLNWGLPYPMHPDERNMAVAIQELKCDISNIKSINIKECLNPHFFAYGQLPLYIAYFFIMARRAVFRLTPEPISFVEATIALRLLSVFASIATAFILIMIIKLLIKQNFKSKIFDSKFQILKSIYFKNTFLIAALLIIFSPYFIQFAHFGTTESLLMLFNSIILYLSLRVLENGINKNLIIKLGIVSGFAIGTKVSSIVFALTPLFAFAFVVFFQTDNVFDKFYFVNTIYTFLIKFAERIKHFVSVSIFYVLIALFFTIISSPHNLINLSDFLYSMKYESSVGTGSLRVFYTRTFDYTRPILFQAVKVLPYSLGLPQYLFSILGILLVGWKEKKINLLRIAFLLVFIPNALLYAKWSRFIAPSFPILTIFAILSFMSIFDSLFFNIKKNDLNTKSRIIFGIKIIICLLFVFSSIVPGIAYLSVYSNPDVRFTASEWIYKNIKSGTVILSETANVIDLPVVPNYNGVNSLKPRYYNNISFDFYNLDYDSVLQKKLLDALYEAEYIFIPSRRVILNHTCYDFSNSSVKINVLDINNLFNSLKNSIAYSGNRCKELRKKYPLLNNYYAYLLSGKLGFKKVAEFNNFPRICLFGKTLFAIPDEDAEETWTVFDHPVVRIYKKI